MDSITSILNNINNFSKSLFKFSQFFEPLLILKHIPSDISYHLNSNDFLYHLDQASSHLNWLNDFFSNHISKVLHKEVSRLKKTQHIDKTIPYADFTVDGLPVFKKEAPAQISFDDILRESVLNGSPLTPVKRRNPDAFTFHGVCPFCGAPEEYIYDNNGKGQFKCKACHNTFTLKTDLSGETVSIALTVEENLILNMIEKVILSIIVLTISAPTILKTRKSMIAIREKHLRPLVISIV